MELEVHPNTHVDGGSEKPLLYNSTSQLVTSQPTYHSHVRHSFAQSDTEHLFAVSVCLAVFCAVCGSPLTLVCFLPAILLSKKV